MTLTLCFQEDDLDILPIGRLSRDSAVFRKEGDTGIMARNLVMGKSQLSNDLLDLRSFNPLLQYPNFLRP